MLYLRTMSAMPQDTSTCDRNSLVNRYNEVVNTRIVINDDGTAGLDGLGQCLDIDLALLTRTRIRNVGPNSLHVSNFAHPGHVCLRKHGLDHSHVSVDATEGIGDAVGVDVHVVVRAAEVVDHLTHYALKEGVSRTWRAIVGSRAYAVGAGAEVEA